MSCLYFVRSLGSGFAQAEGVRLCVCLTGLADRVVDCGNHIVQHGQLACGKVVERSICKLPGRRYLALHLGNRVSSSCVGIPTKSLLIQLLNHIIHIGLILRGNVEILAVFHLCVKRSKVCQLLLILCSARLASSCSAFDNIAQVCSGAHKLLRNILALCRLCQSRCKRHAIFLDLVTEFRFCPVLALFVHHASILGTGFKDLLVLFAAQIAHLLLSVFDIRFQFVDLLLLCGNFCITNSSLISNAKIICGVHASPGSLFGFLAFAAKIAHFLLIFRNGFGLLVNFLSLFANGLFLRSSTLVKVCKLLIGFCQAFSQANSFAAHLFNGCCVFTLHSVKALLILGFGFCTLGFQLGTEFFFCCLKLICLLISIGFCACVRHIQILIPDLLGKTIGHLVKAHAAVIVKHRVIQCASHLCHAIKHILGG